MISTHLWFGYELPLRERVSLVKQAGFEGVMIWWSDEFGNHDFRDAPRYAHDAGLFIENIHTPFKGINNLWLDNLDGNALTERYLKMIDDCVDNDIPTMILHLYSSKSPPPCEIGLNRILQIVEKAEKNGINIAFENLTRTGHLDYVLNSVESDYAGLCFDSGHHYYKTPDDDLLEKHGSRLKALHLHDNDGIDDKHRLPFDGTIDWSETMRKIAQTGYAGAISLEVENMGYDGMPPEEFLQLALQRARRLEGLKRWDSFKCS